MAKFIQVKQANPAKMGKTAHMCLMNTRLAFGITKGTFKSAKRDMQSQKNSGTLHDFSTIPQDLAVPLYSYASLINGHVGLWYKGTYYSDGVKKSLPPRWAIVGWGELCDGVRVVKLSTAGATTGFLPAKGYWKRGDQDQRIATLAEFLQLGAAAHEGDGCRLYAQTVTLRSLEVLKSGSHVGIDAQENIVPAGRTRCGADAAAGRLLQLPGQQVRGEAELLVTFRIADDRLGRKDERGFFPGEDILRQRADQGKVAGQDFRPVAAGKQDQRRHQDGAGQDTESMTGHYFTAGLT